MTRSELDRTKVVRSWLDEGSTDLSPRVLDAVLSGIPATSQDRPHWSPPRLQMSFLAVGAVAAAVTLVVVLVGAGLMGGAPPGGPGPTPAPSATPEPVDPSYRDVGFIGLPPLDAVPSDPTRTELVENFVRSRLPYTGQSFLYADGRLIWVEYFASQTRSTGWLEQTVTPDGIELIRAIPTEPLGQARARLLDPAELPGQLPANAWVDPTVRPYVPSGFAACLVTESPMALPDKLAALPPAAADIMRDRELLPTTRTGVPPYEDCHEMTTAHARLLAAALRAAGLEQDERRNLFLLDYHLLVDRPEAGTLSLNIWFEPILPDGTITCSGCG